MSDKPKEGTVLPKDMNPQAELVAQGATLVRLENTTQMTVAIQRPRDERAILSAALSELDLYPSLADDAIYSKPVGKDDTGKMIYAEGLSIRAAESLANRWGNSAYGVEVQEITEDYALISGVFLDYESNTRHVFPARVSKIYRSKNGDMRKYTPDRFDTVLAAAKSKLLRETILRSLPAGLKREYELKANVLIETQGDIESRKVKMVAAFRKLGIGQESLEKLRGKSIAQFNSEDITVLLGTYNALKDGETTIEALFSSGDAGQEKAKDVEARFTEPTKGTISEPEAAAIREQERKEAEGFKLQGK